MVLMAGPMPLRVVRGAKKRRKEVGVSFVGLASEVRVVLHRDGGVKRRSKESTGVRRYSRRYDVLACQSASSLSAKLHAGMPVPVC